MQLIFSPRPYPQKLNIHIHCYGNITSSNNWLLCYVQGLHMVVMVIPITI